MKKYFFLLLNCCSLYAIAQVSQVLPIKPSPLDTLNISYNPSLPAAKLKGDAVIFARITCYLQDGSIKKWNKNLIAEKGQLSTHLLLPAFAASFKVEFYTLNKEDELAAKSLLVYQKDQQKPVKGAYLDAFFSNKVDSLFQLEISGYPHHYYAYARYINVVSMIKDPEAGQLQIKNLLANLDKELQKKPLLKNDLGWIAAQCIGQAKTGNLKLGKSYLLELFKHYPLAPETAFAFSIYNYENYKATRQSIEADVEAQLKMIFLNYPEAAICADTNVFEYLRKDKSIPTTAFENVIYPLLTKDQLAYYALGNLPELYISRNEKLDTAKQLLHAAIQRFQEGTIQHQYRLNNEHYQLYVPIFLKSLAQIDMLKKDFQQAISHLTAAMQLIVGHSAEGNFLPELLQQRAKAYEAMGNLNLAFADQQKRYLNGEIAAAQEMERLFPFCTTKTANFADFLNGLKTKKGIPGNGKKELAFNFTGTDLQGNKISLAELKGKIVVLNAWGIGCGPCIAEMPELNQLVQAYANRKDVVFLAITGDETEKLIPFLKSKKFDYKVINQVANLNEVFNTNVLPVHMVIGKDGEVLNRSIGARADIAQYLKSIIDINL